jgi:hypothetical protein
MAIMKEVFLIEFFLFQNVEYHNELENVAIKLFNLRKIPSQSKKKVDVNNNQRGPCVHFVFVPSDTLDNIPAFRQWLLSKNQPRSKSSVLSKLVFQGLRIN